MRAFAVLLALCAGCVIGPRAMDHPMMQTGGGVPYEVRLSGPPVRSVSGELLAVTDTGVWLLVNQSPTWVPYTLAVNGAPPDTTRERLRLESRFPQGLNAEILRKLLNAYGQDSAVFLSIARAATAKYRDLSAAQADGYRPMGPVTPAMGQHWVHIGILSQGRLDPAQPAILEYSGSHLVGVAYAIPLTEGEPLPAAPVPPERWHMHRGTLTEEGLSGSHAGMAGDGSGDRVAVLHAWIWLANPAGTFESQNWILPLAEWAQRLSGG